MYNRAKQSEHRLYLIPFLLHHLFHNFALRTLLVYCMLCSFISKLFRLKLQTLTFDEHPCILRHPLRTDDFLYPIPHVTENFLRVTTFLSPKSHSLLSLPAFPSQRREDEFLTGDVLLRLFRSARGRRLKLLATAVVDSFVYVDKKMVKLSNLTSRPGLHLILAEFPAKSEMSLLKRSRAALSVTQRSSNKGL